MTRPGGGLALCTREAAICNAHNFARRAHGRCEATAKFQFPIVGRRARLAIMAIVIRFAVLLFLRPISFVRGNVVLPTCVAPGM